MYKRFTEALFLRGWGLAAGVLILGWIVAPTYFVDGDNAEMSTLGVTGGVAHPPGYPLYVLYLRAMSWLPGETAAQTGARATVILGAVSVMVLHAACRAWGAKPWASTLAVGVFAGSPIVLRLTTATEVFALNVLIVSIVLLCAARDAPLRGLRRTAVLACVAGLGLCNHHTCVLIAPVGILGAIRGVRESDHAPAVGIGVGIASLILGLSPYAYTFLAPASAVSWGEVDSLAELFALFTRRDYGGPGAFSPVAGEIQPGSNLLALAYGIGRAWLWLPAVLGLAVLGHRMKASDAGEPRSGWIALAASFLLAGPLLVLRFNIVPTGMGLAISERFYMLPLALLAVPVAVAIDRVGAAVTARWPVSLLQRMSVQATIGLLVFATATSLSLPHLLATHSPAVQRGVENMLRSLPPGAVVIGTADDLHFGAFYVQELEGLRPDVQYVSWSITTLRWYRAYLAKRGLSIDPYAAGPEKPSLRVARQVFATGRPLFVEWSMGNILTELRTYPSGLLFRVLPPDATMPTLDQILDENRALLAGFDLKYPRPTHDAAYAVGMHIRYTRTWDILTRALRDAGRIAEARDARNIRDWLGLEPGAIPP